MKKQKVYWRVDFAYKGGERQKGALMHETRESAVDLKNWYHDADGAWLVKVTRGSKLRKAFQLLNNAAVLAHEQLLHDEHSQAQNTLDEAIDAVKKLGVES